jgi:hypothetical protein
MTQRVGRNDPCPCGSGKKFKSCHGTRTSMLGRPGGTPRWATVLLLAAGVVLVVLGYRFMTRKPAVPERFPQSGSAAPGAPAPGAPAGAEPAPWTYDAQANRHWDPTHRHWHDGPPPAGATAPGGAASAAGPDPAPWTYDERTGQHWDPNHRHWHPGPPPPAGERAGPSPRAPGDTAR